MLHWFKSLVSRHWPPVLVFVLAAVLLAKVLGTRPYETVRLTGDANVYASKYEISPDERFIIAINSDVTLIDLRNRKKLLSFPRTNDQYRFDSQGRFHWVELSHDGCIFTDLVVVSWWHFDPSTGVRTKLMECLRYFLDHSGGRDQFTGLHVFDQDHEMALLSPDCMSLLLPHYAGTVATYDLYDATGQKRCTLDLPPIHMNATYTTLIEAAFSEDGQALLVQTEERAGDQTGYLLRVYDVTNGRIRHSLRLPGTESLGSSNSSWKSGFHGFDRHSRIWQNKSRLGRVLYFDGKRVIADHNIEFIEGTKGIMSVDFATQQVQKNVFDDLRLSSEEHQRLSRGTKLELSLHVENQWNHMQQTAVSMVQYKEEQSANSRGAERFLPVISFSSRGQDMSQLLTSSKVNQTDNRSYHYLEPCKLLGMLPENRLLIKEVENIPVVATVFLRYFDIVSHWLRLSGNRSVSLVDATSGCREDRLFGDADVVSVHLSSKHDALALLGNDDNGLTLRWYKYPLCKPWTSILAMSFCIALVFAGIRWLVRFLLHRRLRQASYRA